MADQGSVGLVEENRQGQDRGFSQRQKLFYPCAYTEQYSRPPPVTETTVDEELRNFDADFVGLGYKLRATRLRHNLRKMILAIIYTQPLRDHTKKLNLLRHITNIANLRAPQQILNRETMQSPQNTGALQDLFRRGVSVLGWSLKLLRSIVTCYPFTNFMMP
ncbi:hypothetical protein BDV29DRAFT_164330 [Aspergillus leporis]|uniref:Uncharacterized protein n=1 Tax=Aspergillus leporis TaxID=41062 RepID=A0A5N5XFB1_9EURO|nr:hypothetical protein BDV29DRAFT_164330 [Aspergillus leporis]